MLITQLRIKDDSIVQRSILSFGDCWETLSALPKADRQFAEITLGQLFRPVDVPQAGWRRFLGLKPSQLADSTGTVCYTRAVIRAGILQVPASGELFGNLDRDTQFAVLSPVWAEALFYALSHVSEGEQYFYMIYVLHLQGRSLKELCRAFGSGLYRVPEQMAR